MRQYFNFAMVSLPFIFLGDIESFNIQEVLWGWKTYEYLVYCKYRYSQREERWKIHGDDIDECIEEGGRRLDQTCFGDQFYFMVTIGCTGCFLMTIAMEMMVRAEYNMFGDQAFLILAPIAWGACKFSKSSYTWVGNQMDIWVPPNQKTGWHATPGGGDGADEFGIPTGMSSKIKGASHDAIS